MDTKGSNENVKSQISFCEIIAVNAIHTRAFMTLAIKHIFLYLWAPSNKGKTPKYYFYASVCSGCIWGRDIMNT